MFKEAEDINSYRSKIAAKLASQARIKFKLHCRDICDNFKLTELEYKAFESGQLILNEKKVFEILEFFLISNEKIEQSFELSSFLYFYDITEALSEDNIL